MNINMHDDMRADDDWLLVAFAVFRVGPSARVQYRPCRRASAAAG